MARILKSINSKLRDNERTEPYDLEPWIKSNPEILGFDIAIIGRQIPSKLGPIDLLGIASSGNIVVVELKRDNKKRTRGNRCKSFGVRSQSK